MRAADVSFLVLSALLSTPALYAGSCSGLSQLKLPGATVLTATSEAPGAFLPPNTDPAKPEAKLYKKLPAFCRVTAEAHPSPDSHIDIEVWLPLPAAWNGKLRGQGNGGFAGAIDYRGLAGSVNLGYASSATDAGHKGEATDASWALGHPEKVVDFGYRAIHLTAELSKPVVQAFYGKPPARAYFDSCSDGGREALMEAQRFPQDYDGILAGAPANYWTHLLASGLSLQKSINTSPANFIPPDKLPVITNAVLRSCDALDGVRDGILNDPTRCHFDPGVLLCKSAESHACLSAAQVHSLKTIYAGGKDSHGRLIFPPIMPSSEDGDGGWKDWVTGPEFGKASGTAYATGFFQDMVFEDPHWDYHTANIDDATAAADKKLSPVLNSTDPDLKAFKARGGKLILYHGWLDPAISPLNTIDYYNSVVSKMGRSSTDEFVRLYMVPGMQHCAGGPGAFMFGQLGIATARDPEHNVFSALERWTEKGAAPGTIVATKLRDDRDSSKGVLMTRPLCPYPQTAVFKRGSNPTDANSFACSK